MLVVAVAETTVVVVGQGTVAAVMVGRQIPATKMLHTQLEILAVVVVVRLPLSLPILPHEAVMAALA